MKYYLITLLISLKLAWLQKNCTNFVPKSSEECFEFSDNISNYCCYITDNINKFTDHCENINTAEYLTYPNYITYMGKYNLSVNCGNTISSNSLKKCGASVVNNISDCISFSNMENSCCYYNYFGKKGCVLMESSIDTSILHGNFILQCQSSKIKEFVKFLLIINLLLIIL